MGKKKRHDWLEALLEAFLGPKPRNPLDPNADRRRRSADAAFAMQEERDRKDRAEQKEKERFMWQGRKTWSGPRKPR